MTFTALATQLAYRFDAEVGSVATAHVARPAVGVDRKRTAEARVTGLHERSGFALFAEPESLEPMEHDDGETVVQLGAVDIGRLELRPLPQFRGGMER